jgi:nucleotide-binding universal stress UspA family protein
MPLNTPVPEMYETVRGQNRSNPMYRKVMVPVDGSSFAEHALPYAVALASAGGGELRLVTVHEPHPPGEVYIAGRTESIDAQQSEQQQEYLEAVARRVGAQSGIQPETSLLVGTPAGALARFATRQHIDLIVMSTHGRGGLSRLWLGSVADALVRRAHVPTLLVRPAEDSPPPQRVRIRRVLVAVDGSAPAEGALADAATLCAAVDAACTVVRIVVPPTHVISSSLPDTAKLSHDKLQARSDEAVNYLRELVARSLTLPNNTRVEVITGTQAASAIIRCAESEDADVIVVGTRGHGGAARLILGSVADKVIRGSQIPVLVCPRRRSNGNGPTGTMVHETQQHHV